MKRTANFITASVFAIALALPCSALAQAAGGAGAAAGVGVTPGGMGTLGGLNGSGTAGYVTGNGAQGYPGGALGTSNRMRMEEDMRRDPRDYQSQRSMPEQNVTPQNATESRTTR
jgi:hypothetical protein